MMLQLVIHASKQSADGRLFAISRELPLLALYLMLGEQAERPRYKPPSDQLGPPSISPDALLLEIPFVIDAAICKPPDIFGADGFESVVKHVRRAVDAPYEEERRWTKPCAPVAPPPLAAAFRGGMMAACTPERAGSRMERAFRGKRHRSLAGTGLPVVAVGRVSRVAGCC